MKVEYNYKIYTPEIYAVEMSKISIDKFFEQNSKEKLEEIRVIDLSCGSGNLLLPMLEKLLQLSKELYGEYRYNKRWITGFDIDEKTLYLFKEKFDNLLKKYNLTGTLNITHADSLYVEFKEKFDIVIGNPPYLGEKNHKDIFIEIKKTDFGNRCYNNKMDYFYFFIDKGIDILKENGILVYLTTNYWFKADSAIKLRNRLKNEGCFFKIENFNCSIFKDAKGQHNAIFFWIKNHSEKEVKIVEEDKEYKIDINDLFLEDSNKIILIPPEYKKVIDKIKNRSNFLLKDLLNVNQGIVTGADKVFIFDKFEEKFKDYLKPFYKNKDIGKYSVTEKPPFWIMYIDKNKKIDETIFNYLLQFKDSLSTRREVVKNSINWWEIQWARDEDIFLKPKIVVRQRCKTNNFGYSEKEFYGSADIYYLTKKNEDTNLFYILGYLNSTVFLYWFKYIGKQKGKNYEFYSTPLKESPIYYTNNKKELLYIETLVKKQIESFNEKIQEEIDSYFIKKLSIDNVKID